MGWGTGRMISGGSNVGQYDANSSARQLAQTVANKGIGVNSAGGLGLVGSGNPDVAGSGSATNPRGGTNTTPPPAAGGTPPPAAGALLPRNPGQIPNSSGTAANPYAPPGEAHGTGNQVNNIAGTMARGSIPITNGPQVFGNNPANNGVGSTLGMMGLRTTGGGSISTKPQNNGPVVPPGMTANGGYLPGVYNPNLENTTGQKYTPVATNGGTIQYSNSGVPIFVSSTPQPLVKTPDTLAPTAAAPYGTDSYGTPFQSQAQADDWKARVAARDAAESQYTWGRSYG